MKNKLIISHHQNKSNQRKWMKGGINSMSMTPANSMKILRNLINKIKIKEKDKIRM